MKKAVLFLIFQLISTNIFTQQAHKYILFSSGWSYNGILDNGMSRLYYRGHGLVISLGYERYNENLLEKINLETQPGLLKTKNGKASALLLRTEAGYQYLRKYRDFDDGKYILYFGGAFNNLTSFRDRNGYSNSAINYDHFSSLSLSGLINHNFTIKERKFSARLQLTTPLVSLALRPSYAFSFPEEFYADSDKRFKRTVNSMKVVTMAKYFRLRSETSITYFFHNGNAMRLSYRWAYYRYVKFTENELKAASHAVWFSMLLNLGQ